MSSITFEEAIELSAKLLDHIERGELETTCAKEHIAEIVKESAGARGFLVAYLAGDSRIAEEHPPYVLGGLAMSEELISDLIIKNIVMSATMSVLHKRNGNEQLLDGSQKVTRRSVCLAKGLSNTHLKQRFTQMLEAVRSERLSQTSADCPNDNVAQDCPSPDQKLFLRRWKYDVEQLTSAESALICALAAIA